MLELAKVATTRAVIIATLVATASACSLINGDDDAAVDVSPESETATTTEPAATTQPPVTEAASTGSGTLDDPRSILNGQFTYTEDFYDTDWAGELYGLVEVPLESYSEAVGTCYAVIGVISPTRIGEGSISEGFTAPSLGLVVEGVLVDEGFDCDDDLVRDAGYGPLYDAQVTEGTQFAFYDTFLVEGDPAAKPTALIVGDADDNETVYFTADVLPSPPAPDVEAGSGTGGDVEPLAGAQFNYRGEFDDTTWSVQTFGVLAGEKNDFTDQAGSCFIVVGTLTPTELDLGQISDGFDTPDFTVLAGGVAVEDENDCDVDAIEAAGYGTLWDAEVTLGTVYPFYADFFIPEGVTAESVIAGDPTEDGGARFYSVDTITELPAADRSASLGTLPEGITPVTGAGFTYTESFSETSWEAEIDGLVAVELGSFYDDENGQCFAVVGVITPTAIGEGSVTDGFDTPDIGLIASGRSMQWNGFYCDDEALKANGYQELTDAEIPVGTAYPYYVTFFVPSDEAASLDSVFVGDASEADALYYDAALLPALPSRN